MQKEKNTLLFCVSSCEKRQRKHAKRLEESHEKCMRKQDASEDIYWE